MSRFEMRQVGKVTLLPLHEQSARAVDMAACVFDHDGHHWVDITTIGDIDLRFVCERCGALGKASAVLRMGDSDDIV